MTGKHWRRGAVPLGMLIGVAVLAAQFAGVGGDQPASTPRRDSASTIKRLASIPGGSVPDLGSTILASTSVRVDTGETVRMEARASVHARQLVKSGAPAQAVCGIRYSRDGDPAWTLGTPHDSVVLARADARERVAMDRSFSAPARDTYRMAVTCHVSSPGGSDIAAAGTIRTQRGLPEGAATLVK